MKLAEGFLPLQKDMGQMLSKMRNISFMHLPLLLAATPAYAADTSNLISEVAAGDTFPDYGTIF